MKTMYYTTTDNGDGSSSVEFFYDKESIELLEEHDPETYGSGEGGNSFQYTGELDFGPSEWGQPKTLEQVKADIGSEEDEEED